MSHEPGLVDLHRHLDGSLRPSTLEALGAALGRPIPEDIRFTAGMGLAGALERFAITLSVLQSPDAVRRVASEMCEDATAEGITTLEIRFAPQLHRDAPVPEIVDAALDGAAGRAGLVLCALYGDDPAAVMKLVDAARIRPGVVGIDLAGGPAPGHAWAMADYAPAFDEARSAGIGRTVHAGEGRPPQEIRTAIETLHAQRIGHGTTLLDDDAIAQLVIERGVTIEACPTSNAHTGVIDDVRDHPIARWIARGVKVCVCADNTLFSATDVPEEIRRLGLTEDQTRRCVADGHAAAFRR